LSYDAAEKKSSSFLSKLRERLNRGKGWLTGDIGGLLGTKIDDETLDSLEDELLMGDVGVAATEALIEKLRRSSRAAGGGELTLRRLLCNAVEEMISPLAVPLEARRDDAPFVVLVVGVNGAGKTTSIGKLAHRLKAAGSSVLIAAGDTFRAAAVEQLAEWGKRADVPVVAQESGADPAAVIHDALSAAKARKVDVVLADTAGRLHTSRALMDELEKVRRVVKRFDATAPHEILLVLDASQGQNALTQAKQFNEKLGVTGIVLTKLDGTAKGGILLAIARELSIPIRFVAVGEGIDDFDLFDAHTFAAALTGTRDE